MWQHFSLRVSITLSNNIPSLCLKEQASCCLFFIFVVCVETIIFPVIIIKITKIVIYFNYKNRLTVYIQQQHLKYLLKVTMSALVGAKNHHHLRKFSCIFRSQTGASAKTRLNLINVRMAKFYKKYKNCCLWSFCILIYLVSAPVG